VVHPYAYAGAVTIALAAARLCAGAYLDACGIEHVRGAPHHPQTQGKIERWRQTLKNRILLEHYFLPGDLERQIGAFVDYYNNRRYHESLGNLTPADVHHGRGAQILKRREEIKKHTIRQRRCRTKPPPPKLNQKPNQSLRYKRPRSLRNTLTTDIPERPWLCLNVGLKRGAVITDIPPPEAGLPLRYRGGLSRRRYSV
jgi:hypothetical protein